MIKYVVTLKEPKVTLDIMGRKQTFINGDEVTENTYTNMYPQYFKKLGTLQGYDNFLSSVTFIPDTIDEFISKENSRIKQQVVNNMPIEVKIDEIATAIDEFIEATPEVNYEDIEENDVKIETEE